MCDRLLKRGVSVYAHNTCALAAVGVSMGVSGIKIPLYYIVIPTI